MVAELAGKNKAFMCAVVHVVAEPSQEEKMSVVAPCHKQKGPMEGELMKEKKMKEESEKELLAKMVAMNPTLAAVRQLQANQWA